MKKAGHRDRIEQVGMAIWGVVLVTSFAWWAEPIRWVRDHARKAEG